MEEKDLTKQEKGSDAVPAYINFIHYHFAFAPNVDHECRFLTSYRCDRLVDLSMTND